jgi:small subunit ribosomal protein S12
MSTANQIIKYKRKTKLKNNIKKTALQKCPQKKGLCEKVYMRNPKKPNSACRKVADVILSSKKKVICHIPGIRHTLQKFSNVLIRGGRVKDLPGVKYRLVRGKYDLRAVLNRKNARSKYGKKKGDR